LALLACKGKFRASRGGLPPSPLIEKLKLGLFKAPGDKEVRGPKHPQLRRFFGILARTAGFLVLRSLPWSPG
jgi:hypothetical protein